MASLRRLNPAMQSENSIMSIYGNMYQKRGQMSNAEVGATRLTSDVRLFGFGLIVGE